MKRLFLCSAIGFPGVGESIRARLDHSHPLKTAFITTPIEGEDMSDDAWYRDDRRALKDAGFDFFDFTITGKSEADVRRDLAGTEAIYISGGNEFWLKHQANKCNFGRFVQEYVDSGKLCLGTSAGSIIMAPDMTPALQITDINNCPEPITDHTGFGIVDFLPMPHWGSSDFRDGYLKSGRIEKMYGTEWKIILLNNYEYIDVQDGWYQIVDVRREL